MGACLACRMAKVKRTGRQDCMQMWHPSARFEMVAVDVLEISPTSGSGMKKVLVIGRCVLKFHDGSTDPQ